MKHTPLDTIRAHRSARLVPGQRAAAPRPHKPGALERLATSWWNRLVAAVYEGGLSAQEAEYFEHQTQRDYLWNTAGTAAWGLSFPLLTIVCTQLVGTEAAGRFAMAFVTGTLLMIAAGYGVRTHQVSDIDERASFASYQVNRWITGLLALGAGFVYISARGYDAQMTAICGGVYVYKVIDGIADVYEGRLQQADKLYLAGISQTLRSVAAVGVFAVALFVLRSLVVASIAMAIAAAATFVLVTAPLALLETEKSRPAALSEVLALLKGCLPLAGAILAFNLIETMPKFVMEGALAYENQLYFNALYFPAQGILLAVGFLYKPQLVRLASIWANPRRRRRFDLIVGAVFLVTALITLGMGALMGWVGLDAMGVLYGLDFQRFRVLAFLMVAAGGVTAAIDFLYAVVCVLRRAGDVTRAYLISVAASVVAPLVLVNLAGLTGAVASYLGVMVLLLVLLVIDYVRIRSDIRRERNPFGR